MVPPAPGRFSTISGCPLANCAKPFDRLRDSVSAAPPAPTVTKQPNRAVGPLRRRLGKGRDGCERGKCKGGERRGVAARKTGEVHDNSPRYQSWFVDQLTRA